MAIIGTPTTQGFYTITQRPIEEAYLNDAAPWSTVSEALAGIPIGNRYPGMPVYVLGIVHIFSADMTTLEPLAVSNDQTASEVPITDTGGFFESTEVEGALQEVGSALTVINNELADLNGNPYKISMPAGNIATKVAGATFTPTGWGTVEQSGATNILITSTLTGRKARFINVFEVDGSNETLLSVEKGMAYTQFVNNGLTTLLYGFAPTTLPVEVSLIFD